MPNTNTSLNYAYVDEAIKENLDVAVYLINGVALKGKILAQDEDCVIMTCTASNSATKKQLVFKNSMSTIIT